MPLCHRKNPGKVAEVQMQCITGIGLSAFEHYFAECERRNPAAAALHAYLCKTTAQPRHRINKAFDKAAATTCGLSVSINANVALMNSHEADGMRHVWSALPIPWRRTVSIKASAGEGSARISSMAEQYS